MATLTVGKFETADSANGALAVLERQQLIEVVDAADVRWPEGAEKPKTEHLHSGSGRRGPPARRRRACADPVDQHP